MLILLEVIKSGILEKVIYVFLKMSFIHISLILESLKQNEFHMLPVGGGEIIS